MQLPQPGKSVVVLLNYGRSPQSLPLHCRDMKLQLLLLLLVSLAAAALILCSCMAVCDKSEGVCAPGWPLLVGCTGCAGHASGPPAHHTITHQPSHIRLHR